MSAMDSDAVNSISENEEASSIADMIETTYYDLVTNRTIPEHKEIFELTALSDSTRPAMMEIPSTVEGIEWIQYDKRQSASDTRLRWEDVVYKKPRAMMNLLNSRDSTNTTDVVIMPSKNTTTVDFLILNNVQPSFWTVFDDHYVVFDSYVAAIDTTVEQGKTKGYGTKEPTWTKDDTFVPDLDINLFPLLLSASKAVCLATFKSSVNPTVSGAARSHLIRTQANKSKSKQVNDGYTALQPSFGRK
tara:strand:- start:2498 stop:3235 length:738 start_codon:yes stop_codon:yes gene_type:complete